MNEHQPTNDGINQQLPQNLISSIDSLSTTPYGRLMSEASTPVPDILHDSESAVDKVSRQSFMPNSIIGIAMSKLEGSNLIDFSIVQEPPTAGAVTSEALYAKLSGDPAEQEDSAKMILNYLKYHAKLIETLSANPDELEIIQQLEYNDDFHHVDWRRFLATSLTRCIPQYVKNNQGDEAASARAELSQLVQNYDYPLDPAEIGELFDITVI